VVLRQINTSDLLNKKPKWLLYQNLEWLKDRKLLRDSWYSTSLLKDATSVEALNITSTGSYEIRPKNVNFGYLILSKNRHGLLEVAQSAKNRQIWSPSKQAFIFELSCFRNYQSSLNLFQIRKKQQLVNWRVLHIFNEFSKCFHIIYRKINPRPPIGLRQQ